MHNFFYNTLYKYTYIRILLFRREIEQNNFDDIKIQYKVLTCPRE